MLVQRIATAGEVLVVCVVLQVCPASTGWSALLGALFEVPLTAGPCVVFCWCLCSLGVVVLLRLWGLGASCCGLATAYIAVAVQLPTLQRLLVCVEQAEWCSFQPMLLTGHRAGACLLAWARLFACMVWQLAAPWLGWLRRAVQVRGASTAAAQQCTDPHTAHNIARAQAFWSALLGCTAHQQQPGSHAFNMLCCWTIVLWQIVLVWECVGTA